MPSELEQLKELAKRIISKKRGLKEERDELKKMQQDLVDRLTDEERGQARLPLKITDAERDSLDGLAMSGETPTVRA
jgi:hypothetical protein